MAALTILAHASRSYGPRTYVNAREAQLTAAFAVDYTSAGERLTHKAAGDAYIALPLAHNVIENARQLYRALKDRNVRCLNVAGNGIYTLARHGLTQEECNLLVYLAIQKAHEHWPLSCIRCGGQTGIDLAGAVAGFHLGIDTLMYFPAGFRQRDAEGIDSDHSEEEIRMQVQSWSEKVSVNLPG